MFCWVYKLNYTHNMKLAKSILNWIVFILLSLIPLGASAQTDSTYTLSIKSVTSAGVYQNGRLIKTLWSNKEQPAGSYVINWNRRNDSNIRVYGNYKYSVIANNLTYRWKANLGNTSIDSIGSNKIRGLRAVFDGVEVGNNLYFCKGNTEGNSPIFKLLKNNIQKMYELRITGSTDMQTEYVCSDSNLVYWAGYDAWTGYWPTTNKTPPDTNSRVKALIYATRVSNDLDYTFSSGKTIKPSLNGFNTYSAIGVIFDDTLANPTGLAVMKTGSYLYCTYFRKGEVRCYNKTTGAFIRTISLPLKNICILDSVVYGINGNFIKGYKINSNGSLTANSFSISISNPLNVKSLNGLIYVLVGSTQQIKVYNTSGTLQWTHGQSGGYKSSPYVKNDKFHFVDPNTLDKRGFLFPCRDGSFWVGDIGNCRQLHFSSSRSYLEQFSYIPTSYNTSASKNSPGRVFSGFLEFNADSNKLVANWEGNLKSGYLNPNRREIFSDIFVSNNRTFATIHYYPNGFYDDGDRTPEYVELTDTGIRYTGIRLQQPSNRWLIYSTVPNGDRFRYEYVEMSSGTDTVFKRTFTGLNGSGNPTWGTESVFSLVPITANAPIRYCAEKINSSLVFFSANWANTGYHLGKIANNKWAWMTCRSTPRAYTGPMPVSDSFDCGNGVEYAGGRCYNVDSFYAWNYIGEFWKNSQTNVWKLFHKDGLMLMNFGKTGLQSEAISGTLDAPIEASGNSFAGQMVKNGNKLKIYYNDESRHGAIGSFEISGLNTIRMVLPLIPLPADPNSISATCMGENIRLNWLEVDEFLNYSHKLEYSVDGGITWTKISKLDYKATGTAVKEYSVYIRNFGIDNCIYKVSKIDEEGKVRKTYFVRQPSCDGNQKGQIYPNPFSDKVFVVVPNLESAESYQLIIRDNSGRVVIGKKLLCNSDDSIITYEILEASKLSEGIYSVSIVGENFIIFQTKIVKI